MNSRLVLVFAALFATSVHADVKKLEIDKNQSYVEWIGRKVTGAHNGKVMIKEGHVEIDKDTLKGGKFVIDMASIDNEDLDSAQYKKKLENHLKSDDFFNIKNFPTSTFEITKVDEADDGKVTLTGNLTVKGISLPVTIPAMIEKDGKTYTGTGKVTLNRTKWDIRYNSGKFFDPKQLGDKLIYDDIDISLKVVATES